MTRLNTNHIENIPYLWEEYEKNIKNTTGYNLFEMASFALDVDTEKAKNLCKGKKIAVIPISSGEGFISGFAEVLKSICEHLDFKSSIVRADEQGFEDFRRGDFDLAIWASDDEYFVENKNETIKIDNNIATGKGFAEILNFVIKSTCQSNKTMLEKINSCETISNKRSFVLIRGCGPIGTNAAYHLGKRGYHINLYDINEEKSKDLLKQLLSKNISASLVSDIENLEMQSNVISALFDAAPNPAQEDSFCKYKFDCISAPCVPCLWEEKPTLWHDPLQLGTAVMLIAAATNTAI